MSLTIYGLKSKEETDAAHKKRQEFSKVNDYEKYNWNICFECMNFMVNLHGPQYGGNCKLMEVEGAYPGVCADAVCNKFLSCSGKDINNKPVDSSEWPEWVHPSKELISKKKGFIHLESDLRKYAVKDLIATHLMRMFNLDPETLCEVVRDTAARNVIEV